MGVEGHGLRSAVHSQAPTLQQAIRGGHQLPGLGHLDPGNRLSLQLQGLNAHGQRRDGLVGNQCGQAGEVAMIGMQPSRGAIVFNSQEQVAALGVGQGHHRSYQVPVRQAFDVALELDGEALAAANERLDFLFGLVHGYPQVRPIRRFGTLRSGPCALAGLQPAGPRAGHSGTGPHHPRRPTRPCRTRHGGCGCERNRRAIP